MKKFDSRIAQADVLLQILIEQTESLEERISTVEDDLLKTRLERISRNFNVRYPKKLKLANTESSYIGVML